MIKPAHLLLLLFAPLFLLVCSAHASAQGFRVEGGNPPKVTSETFTSPDSRFSIALPQQVTGFGPYQADTPEGKVTLGSSYMWRTEVGQFRVAHMDYSKMPKAGDEPKAIVSGVIEAVGVVAEVAKMGGKLLSNTEVRFPDGAGREVRAEMPDNTMFIFRVVAGNKQLYQLFAAFKKDPKLEDAATKILDSFRALSPADVEAAMAKRVEESMPSPLPQSPASPRLKSDAEDEGLKGKVKTVFTENEDLSGTWTVQRRKPSSMAYYDERGNRTKSVSYDYKGNPMDIIVYGYIDGQRVSKIGSVRHEYDPPPVKVSPPAGKPEPKYDPRFTYRFTYRYDDRGNLAERLMYHSDGELYLRHLHNFKGGQRERLTYSADGKLNQKYLETLDDKGNVVEETIFEAKDDSVRSRYRYAYEFDAQGNWTKKTSSKLVTKDGESRHEPSSVTYRTITYY